MKITECKIIQEYARLSDLYGDAIETGNHKKANKAYDELMAVYQQIKAQGALTSDAFHELLSAPSMGTRLWAATHYLVISYEESEKVLTALGNLYGYKPSKIDCETALEFYNEYRKLGGNIEIKFEDICKDFDQE